MMRIFLFAWALLLCWPVFADAGVRIVVPARDIARGATISQADLATKTVDGNVLSGTVTSVNDIVGMQTRRVLHAGESVRLEDVRRPTLVTKGSTVTMIFEAPGITLTAAGRAMSEGGLGETVTVQNPVSFRQVGAIVTGPGQVSARNVGASLASRLASVQP
jgi:flagella basal body P-ring formation protein FlgA